MPLNILLQKKYIHLKVIRYFCLLHFPPCTLDIIKRFVGRSNGPLLARRINWPEKSRSHRKAGQELSEASVVSTSCQLTNETMLGQLQQATSKLCIINAHHKNCSNSYTYSQSQPVQQIESQVHSHSSHFLNYSHHQQQNQKQRQRNLSKGDSWACLLEPEGHNPGTSHCIASPTLPFVHESHHLLHSQQTSHDTKMKQSVGPSLRNDQASLASCRDLNLPSDLNLEAVQSNSCTSVTSFNENSNNAASPSSNGCLSYRQPSPHALQSPMTASQDSKIESVEATFSIAESVDPDEFKNSGNTVVFLDPDSRQLVIRGAINADHKYVVLQKIPLSLESHAKNRFL
ncbi:unnamed protein product [Protopolystoma xenopodis]|uniref:Uncharacterized protein n=1 Tax=Protopolystoma xenopodis TaxID=117903 RepID=A0A448XKK6_9PLAT|nr:unnamed protein product [Protopolystoma xenopodis]